MRLIFAISIIFVCAVFITSCKNKYENHVAKLGADSLSLNSEIDSLKWLYYAYTFYGKAVFNNKDSGFIFDPVTCNVVVTDLFRRSDSLFIFFKYDSTGLNFDYITGFNFSGFNYFSSAAKPLISAIQFNGFETFSKIKDDNHRTDSAFRVFLKNRGTANLSNWLLLESKKRNIF